MKIILKDIPKLDHLFQGGETDEHYDKRRISKESDSYVLQGNDQDITTISNWLKYSSKLNSDFMQTRSYVLELFRWSNNHTVEEIDQVIDIFGFDPTVDTSTNDNNKVVHLMTTKGMTQEQAQLFLVEKFADFHTKEKESYSQRRNSKQITIIVSSSLSFDNARDFIETTKTLMDLYSESGVVGLNYGVVGEGIIDYIESTAGSSYENTGLEIKGYFAGQSDPAASLQSFIDALKDVLINGNY